MKYTFEKAEKSTVKVTIDLDKNEWAEAINAAYERTKGRYSLPGFRKGKVPKHLLESTYGKGVFYEGALFAVAGAIVVREDDVFAVG